MLDAKAPLMMKGNFKPGFRIGLHIKDLQNALDTAHELGAPLPLAARSWRLCRLARDGKAGDDHGGIVQFYERTRRRASPNRAAAVTKITAYEVT